MSASAESFSELRAAFLAGEIDRDEFLERIQRVPDTGGRDELWARWAEQGQFDRALEQEGYTSFAGARVEEVDGNGER